MKFAFIKSNLQAFDVVASGKAVLGPSEDGGYYLIGLPRPSPNVFREIPWSTSEVFRVTRDRLEGCWRGSIWPTDCSTAAISSRAASCSAWALPACSISGPICCSDARR